MTQERFVTIVVWGFILGGVALLVLGRARLPEFYNPGFMAGAAFASAVAIVVPALLLRSVDRQAVLRLQQVIAAAVTLNAIGALGAYRLYLVGFEYDKLVHFLVPLIGVLALSDLFRHGLRWRFRTGVLWAFGLVLVGAAAWELYEWLVDGILGTKMFGHYGESVVRDTVVDLACNVMGALSATAYVVLKRLRTIG